MLSVTRSLNNRRQSPGCDVTYGHGPLPRSTEVSARHGVRWFWILTCVPPGSASLKLTFNLQCPSLGPLLLILFICLHALPHSATRPPSSSSPYSQRVIFILRTSAFTDITPGHVEPVPTGLSEPVFPALVMLILTTLSQIQIHLLTLGETFPGLSPSPADITGKGLLR